MKAIEFKNIVESLLPDKTYSCGIGSCKGKETVFVQKGNRSNSIRFSGIDILSPKHIVERSAKDLIDSVKGGQND